MIKDIPVSREEAKKQNRTYYIAHRQCGIHKTSFHWTANGKCMACHDIDGRHYTEVLRARKKP